VNSQSPPPRHDDLDPLRHSASMADIAHVHDPQITTPQAAIEALMQGNQRFFSGHPQRAEITANTRRAQIMAQTPFAVVLGCSDSRVPTELIFDQGPGNIFSVRVAGNVVDPVTIGSIEYALMHLKCQLIVIMGHEGCGAVKAALLSDQQIAAEPEHVRYLIEQIRPAVRDMPPIRDPKARMREAIMHNVRLQAHRLRQNAVVQQQLEAARIAVIGAFYEIGSGAVDFLISAADLALELES
jgi:carbonic anhydrase